MYNFYEIRNKGTHRIEYMDLFPADQKPDEAFRKNPVSKSFAGRLDLYINIASEQFESYEKAMAHLHQKRLDYKLLKEANEEARTEDPQPKKRVTKKKDSSIIVGETLETRPDLDLLGGSINNVTF